MEEKAQRLVALYQRLWNRLGPNDFLDAVIADHDFASSFAVTFQEFSWALLVNLSCSSNSVADCFSGPCGLRSFYVCLGQGPKLTIGFGRLLLAAKMARQAVP